MSDLEKVIINLMACVWGGGNSTVLRDKRRLLQKVEIRHLGWPRRIRGI